MFKAHSIFFLILGLSTILRFIPLFDYQYTLDELSGLIRTDFHNFGDLIEKGVKIDAHPALVQVLIFCLVKLAGYANWIIKLPFLLMSLGAIVYAYLFSIRNFSKQAGVFSALLLSFSLIFVFYAPIARMYISGVFFSAGLLFYFYEIFFLRHLRLRNYFLLAVFALLSALNQHLNALFAFTLCASGLLFLDKTTARAYLITCLAIVLCYLPHLPVTLYQLGVGGIGLEQNGWLPVPGKGALLVFLKILLGTGKTYLLFLVGIALAFTLKKNSRLSKKQMFLLFLFLLNYAIIYFYSVFRAPVFQNSAMLFSSVACVLFVASLLEYKSNYVFYGVAAVIGLALLYKTYVRKDYFHQAVQTVFEYQFERTVHYKKLYGDQAVYPIFFDADDFMKDLYCDRYKTRFDCKLSSDSLTRSTGQFTRFLAGLRSDYLVLASSTPAQQACASAWFPYLVENTQTQAINYKVYSRRPEEKKNVVKEDSLIKHSDLETHGNFNYTKINNKMISPASFFFPVDRSNEFPFDALAGYWNIISSEGQVLLVKTRFKSLGTPLSGKLATCISATDASSGATYGYASKDLEDFIPSADSSVTEYVDYFVGTTHQQVSDKAMLQVYIWNKGKDRFSLTGFEISLIDFWHQKWHFWD